MTVLVTGGTGTLGRPVVARLLAARRDVRVLSRRPASDPSVDHVACDLRTGVGLDAAVAGAPTIVHLAGGPKGDDVATRHLVQAARAAGVAHLVFISIIGVDRVPIGFYRAKAAAEREVEQGGVPYTLVRAAQFHDLVLVLAQKLAVLPVVLVPSGVRLQPVDADEVAARLVELTLGSPAGRVTDVAGPQVRPLGDLVRAYLAAQGSRRPVVPVPLPPGGLGRAYRQGRNLSDAAPTGTLTWEEFLARRRPGGRTAGESERPQARRNRR